MNSDQGTVLIVDDERSIRLSLRTILSSLGFYDHRSGQRGGGAGIGSHSAIRRRAARYQYAGDGRSRGLPHHAQEFSCFFLS